MRICLCFFKSAIFSACVSSRIIVSIAWVLARNSKWHRIDAIDDFILPDTKHHQYKKKAKFPFHTMNCWKIFAKCFIHRPTSAHSHLWIMTWLSLKESLSVREMMWNSVLQRRRFTLRIRIGIPSMEQMSITTTKKEQSLFCKLIKFSNESDETNYNESPHDSDCY